MIKITAKNFLIEIFKKLFYESVQIFGIEFYSFFPTDKNDKRIILIESE